MKYIPKLQNGKTIVQQSDATRTSPRLLYKQPIQKLNTPQDFARAAEQRGTTTTDSLINLGGKPTEKKGNYWDFWGGRLGTNLNQLGDLGMGVAKTVGASAALATGMGYSPAVIGTLGTLGKGLLAGAVVDQGYSLLGGRPASIGEIGFGAGATMGMPLVGKGLVKGGEHLLGKSMPYLTGIKKSFLKSFDNRSFKENLMESAPLLFKAVTNPKVARRISMLPEGIAKTLKDSSVEDINKIAYTYNKIQKSGIPIGNPAENTSSFNPRGSFASLQKDMTEYLTLPIVNSENLKKAGRFSNYLSRDFNDKLGKITNPELRNIIETSPQYIEEVYEHSINPKVTDNEFVDNLVKQANTFQRWLNTPAPVEEVSKIRGGSIGFGGKFTIDVDGIKRSGDYGDFGYLFEPKSEFLENIKNLPLSEKWKNRIPVGNNVSIDQGMHWGSHPKFIEYQSKRNVRSRIENPFANLNIPINRNNFSNVNPKYIDPGYHMVFNTTEKNTVLPNFNIKKISDIFPNTANYHDNRSTVAAKYKKLLDNSGILSKGYITVPAIGTYGLTKTKE